MRITSTAVLNFGETMMDNLRNGKRLAILLAVSGCLFAADPIFLRRQVSDVKPQPDDLTAVNAKAASYKPLFGIGDPDVAQLKGVARYGELTVGPGGTRSEEHTSELQSLRHLVCRLLLE